MKILTDNDVAICLEKFRHLIEKEIPISDLFKLLDDVMYKYSRYVLEDADRCGSMKIESAELYYLRLLRALFILEEGE